MICRLHRQLARNRNHGLEQVYVCGRTGYPVKATLLSHGYTMVIKATAGTIFITSGACKEIRSPSVLGPFSHGSHIGTMVN